MEASALFNPFPGLRPYEPDEDHLFFGREKEIDELLRRLRTTRFLSVIGTSGSGKSSLVRSGLIPSLHSGAMVKAGSSWRVAIFRPGEDPIGHLAAALNALDVLGTAGELADTNRVLLEATLRRSTLGLVEALRLARTPAGDNLLVVVDQFEELFRFRHSRKIENSRDEAVSFAKLLLEATQQSTVPIYVVLTMRSDFIGDCMEYPGLAEAVSAGQYLVPRMTRDELQSAITGPAAVAGADIAPRLVFRLLNDVGDDPDQLPVLQHALMRTWDHWERYRQAAEPIDIPHYEAIGTMSEALSLHAEEAYHELISDRAARIAERLFKALTDTSSDSRGVRRPTSVQELSAVCEADGPEVASVIEIFRRPGRTFLMPPVAVPLDSRLIIDISHESLMRGWKRLVGWAGEERVSAEHYMRLSRAAVRYERGTAGLWRDPELEFGLRWRRQNHPTEAWAQRYDPAFKRAMDFLERSENERDRSAAEHEKERRRKLRRAWQVAGTLATLLLIAAFLAVFAWRQQIRANIQRTRADQNLNLAKNAVDELLASAGRQSGRVAADLPDMEEFRRELLEKAGVFYSKFGDQKPDSEEFRREIALAHFRLGDIYRLLQHTEASSKEYHDAIDRFEQLTEDFPGNPAYRQWLANSYNWLGESLRSLEGSVSAAEKAYDSALHIQAKLADEFPDNDMYRQELARSHYNRGILRSDAGNPDDTDYRYAIRLLKPLAKGNKPLAQQELARTFNNLGLLLRREQQLAEAAEAFHQAIGIHEELTRREPANREYRLELAKFSNNLGILLQEQGKLDLANRRSLQALDLFEGLARPVSSLAAELAHSHNLRGRILEDEDRLTDAGREYTRSVDLFRQLEKQTDIANRPDFRMKYGEALYSLASWRRQNRDFTRAARLLSEAVEQHAAAPNAASHLAYDYLMLARVHLEGGSASQAKDAAEKLGRLLPNLSEHDRGALTWYYDDLRTKLARLTPTR